MKMIIIFSLIILVMISAVSAIKIVDNPDIIDIGDGFYATFEGNEELLTAEATNVNETATDICIDHKDKAEYKRLTEEQGHTIDTVPLNITKNKDKVKIKDNKDKVDLSFKFLKLSSKDCFTIEYENKSDIKLKVGWHSIIISTLFTATSSLDSEAEELVIDSNNVLHAVYIDSGSNIHYANSSTWEDDWGSLELQSGIFNYPTILLEDDDDLQIHLYNFGDGNDRDYFLGNATGLEWSDIIQGNDYYAQNKNWRCELDSNDQYHCVYSTTNGNGLYYNTSHSQYEQVIFASSLDDSDSSTLSIAPDNEIYILSTGSDQNDLDIWQRTNGLGDAYRVHIKDNTLLTNRFKMIIDSDYNMVYGINDRIGAITNLMLFKNNTNWTRYDSIVNYTGIKDFDITLDENGVIHVVMGECDTASTGCKWYYVNSSDGGSTYSNNITLDNLYEAYFTDIVAKNGTLHMIYVNRSNSDLYYRNYTYSSGAVEDSCSCPSLDTDWAVTMSDNCVISSPCDIGNGNITFTGSGTFTCSDTITFYDRTEAGTGNLIMDSDCWLKHEI